MSCIFAYSGRHVRKVAGHRPAATTSDQPIVSDVQQRLNDPAAGPVGDHHGSAVRLQLFQFKRGYLKETVSPVGRYTFLTLDDLPASAGALDHSACAVHGDNLIE
jgi:hypothetical protein